jgi:hypothetical protein
MKDHTKAANPTGSNRCYAPLLIFMDTEFTNLDSLSLPDLISIGLVAENGQSFCAELRSSCEDDGCSNFTKAEVLPLLEGGDFLMPKQTARRRIISWIDSFPRQVRIVVDSQYDWELMVELLSNTRPSNMHPKMLYFSPSYFIENDKKLGIGIISAQEQALGGLPCHHALRDSMQLKAAWEVVEKSNHPDFYKLEL